MTTYRNVAQLMDELAVNPMIDLPTITREEWRAVQDQPIFRSSAEAAAWDALDEPRRRDLLAAGQRSLLARNLLRLRAGDTDFDVDPVLQLALATRVSPEFVTVAGPQSTGEPVVLAYGVADERPAVLLEFVLIDGLSKLALATRTEAAAQVAAYLVQHEGGDDLTVHRIETFLPGGSSTGRMLVSAAESAAAVRGVDRDGHPGELESTSLVPLAKSIESCWMQTSTGARL